MSIVLLQGKFHIMIVPLAAFLLAFVRLPIASGQLSNDWFVTVEREGESAMLDCQKELNYSVLDPNQLYGWMKPDLAILNSTYDDGRVRVEPSNWTLTVGNISHGDLGLYHCMVQETYGGILMVRMGINVKGPFFTDMWEMYRMNTIIGCSAFGVFLILCLLFWLIYRFQWKEPNKVGPTFEADFAHDNKPGSANGYAAGSAQEPANGHIQMDVIGTPEAPDAVVTVPGAAASDQLSEPDIRHRATLAPVEQTV